MGFCSSFSSDFYLSSTFNIGPCWEDLLPAIILALYVSLFCSCKLSLLWNISKRKKINLKSKMIIFGFCMINVRFLTFFILNLL